MIKEILEGLNALKGSTVGLGIGVSILAGLFILRRLIESKRVRERFGDFMEGAGVALSNFLMGRLGAKLVDKIELFILDIKAIIDIGLARFELGLRKDNIEAEQKKEEQKQSEQKAVKEKEYIKVANEVAKRNIKRKSGLGGFDSF